MTLMLAYVYDVYDYFKFLIINTIPKSLGVSLFWDIVYCLQQCHRQLTVSIISCWEFPKQ